MACVTSYGCSLDLLCSAMPLLAQSQTLRAHRTKIRPQSGEFANRKGIYPALAGAEKINYVQMEVLEASNKREFGKIFLR